jgi:hypothetical protein
MLGRMNNQAAMHGRETSKIYYFYYFLIFWYKRSKLPHYIKLKKYKYTRAP